MEIKRKEKRAVEVGSVTVGGKAPISVQSMAAVKTSKVDAVISQIKEALPYGLDIMRVSVLDEEDGRALARLTRESPVPIVADIHFDYRLALLAAENGVAAIRINPGNIGSEDRVKAVVEACRTRHIPIRIGINGGSLFKDHEATPEEMVEAARKHVAILERNSFYDIVISLKSSSPLATIEANRLADKSFPYPLHLGATEAGPKDVSLIRSAAVLSPLLLEGIGDTIRLSMSEPPLEEVKAGHRLLRDLGLEERWPFFVSCPTCGRTMVDLMPLAKKVQAYLEARRLPIKVAVMGCIVNGPGEARDADIGLAGGHGVYALFKKGKIIKTVNEKDAYDVLIAEIEKGL